MPHPVQLEAAPLNPLPALLAQIDAKRNLPLGIAAGFVGALIGGCAWAGLVLATKYEIGYVAIGIAFLVGFGMRRFGNGRTPVFGYAGAALAIFGVAFGYVADFYGAVYLDSHPPLGALFAIPLSVVEQGIASGFSAMDLLFLGIAGYFGYRYSIRTLTKEEIATLRA